MRYTAMMWYRRANMAALGGGADIMPDEPHAKDCNCPDCQPEYAEGTDPVSDEPFEKENEI